jgi:hypothetical protein
MWFRTVVRLSGFLACASVAALVAQWPSISFGWDPLVDADTADRRADDIVGLLRAGPAMLVAARVGIVI